MKRILQFPKKQTLEKMGDIYPRDDSDDYFDIIRGWVQNADTARFYLSDLTSKGKLAQGSRTHLNLIKACQLDKRLRNLATAGLQSPMAREIIQTCEVS